MKTVVLKIARLHTIYILSLAFACKLCVFGLFKLIEPWYVAHFGETGSPDMSGFSEFAELLLVCIFAPVFETLLFQWLPIYLLLRIKYFRTHYLIPIVVSASLFALTHHYSVFYILYAFFGSWIYATLFLVAKEKHDYPTAFGLTALVHGAFNFVMFLYLNL